MSQQVPGNGNVEVPPDQQTVPPEVGSAAPVTAAALKTKSPYSGPLHAIAVNARMIGNHIFPPVLPLEILGLAVRKILPRRLGFGKENYEPKTDVPDLKGRVILVTGGNAGLGRLSVLEFARHGAKVYMASRTESKARKAIEDIKAEVLDAQIEFLELDLNSLASVKRAAEEFIAKEAELHVLLNNAGIMATPPEMTEDGLEAQWQTNYVGHALLTKLLLPVLIRTAESAPKDSVRIVNLTSSYHRMAVYGIVYEDIALQGSNKWVRYGQSKLANVLHTQALAKRYGDKGIISIVVHPGIVYTDLFNPYREAIGTVGHYLLEVPFGLLLRTVREGSFNQIAACTSPEVTLETHNGCYLNPHLKFTKPLSYARKEENADKLWDYTEELLREKGY